MIPYHLRSFTNISEFEDRGIAGSFKAGSKSLNIRKAIDSLTCQQALVDEARLSQLAVAIIGASDGQTYFFLKDGNIYRKTIGGTYTEMYTDPDGVITGACEWFDRYGNTYLYWATLTRLHRKRIIGASYTPETWADVDAALITGSGPTSGDPWPKTNLTASPFHTMKVVTGQLLITNAAKLALVGYDNSYQPEALALVPGTYAKALIERSVYGIIGTYRSDAKDESMLYVWDLNSLDYNQKSVIPVGSINAMIDTEVGLMQVGANGQIYVSDPNTIMPILTLAGGGQCNPLGVTNDRGIALFGIYGNTLGYNGIWSYGRTDKQHPIALNFEYPLDCDEIGSIAKVGTDILISYSKNGAYKIAKVDINNKAQATYCSLDFVAPIGTRRYQIPLGRQLMWGHITLGMAELPLKCGVEAWYRLDKKATQYTLPNGTTTDTNGWIQATGTNNETRITTALTREAVFQVGEKARVFEVMVKLFPFGNTTPEIHEINTYFDAG